MANVSSFKMFEQKASLVLTFY